MPFIRMRPARTGSDISRGADSMNINNLETFVWVVRFGSFTKAAQKLNASQPTVSMRIRELEKNLGVSLFDRRHKSFQLTPKGRDLMEYAVKVVSYWTEAQLRLGASTAINGRVRLGVTETIALTWLPAFVARLNSEFPEIILELDVGLTHGIWNDLEAGRVDLALLPGPAHGPGMTTVSLGSIHYTWMASPALGIPGETLSPRDLQAWPVVTLSRDSNLYDIIEEWFRRGKAEPRRIDACNSLGVVVRLTISGLGISLLPPTIYDRKIKSGALNIINVSPAIKPLQFAAVYRQRRGAILEPILAKVAQSISTFESPTGVEIPQS